MAAEVAHVLTIVLHEPQAEKPLAEWVASNAVAVGLKDDVDEVVTAVVPGHPVAEQYPPRSAPSNLKNLSPTSAETAAVLVSPTPTQLMTMALVDKSIAAQQHLCMADAPAPTSVATSDAPQPPPPPPAVPLLCLIVMVFWDGQSESSKATLAELKTLTERKWMMAHVPAWVDHVEVLVQALNAKRGEATIMNNKVALVASLRKKLQTSAMAGRGCWREGAEHRRSARHVDPNAASQGCDDSTAAATAASGSGTTKQSPALPAPTVLGEADLSVAAIYRAVENGQGEAFFLISGWDRAGLENKITTLRTNCATAEVGLAPVMTEPREVNVPAASGAGGASPGTAASNNAAASAATSAGPTTGAASAASTTVVAQEFLLRRRCPPAMHLELRLAMCGNVDSGKSTLTSVLTRGCRDDGRGQARAFVFNHKHEAVTGRTSSVSENHLGFSAEGGVVNYALLQPHRGDAESRPPLPSEVALQQTTAAAPAGGAPHLTRHLSAQDLAARSSKVVTLYDLAGHERYLKTTVLGMTRNMPDYACIVISANNGIQRMTKEHLALCLALKLPFYIVVTRIDAAPPNVHDETLANIHKLLKIPTVKKLPYPVRRHDEVILAAKNLRHDRIAPIFEVSNVTGVGIPGVLQFINLLPVRKDWRQARTMPREMIIDSTFFVTGVGTVVGGIITQGVFRVNDTVLLGPDGFGHFRPVSIKSIHIKGIDSSAAEAGSDAALCLKKEKRSAIRKGNILADTAHPPKSYWQFEAEITILYHSTTIAANYEPVIHSTTVRQSARITYVAQEVLRTGDRSLARFHFLYRPEYMKVGQRLIFREGRTKGIGVVTTLICESDEGVLAKNKVRKKMQEKLHAPAATK